MQRSLTTITLGNWRNFQLSELTEALVCGLLEIRVHRISHGALAQLVERFNGIEEVSGSNPLCSTTFKQSL